MPWSSAQRRLLVAVNGLGALVLALAWMGSRSTDTLDDQVMWLNLSMFGIVIAAAADALWLLSGRRSIRALIGITIPHPDPHTITVGDTATSGGGEWVHIAGTRRIHRHTCPLVAGKPAKQVAAPNPSAAGPRLQDCEVCT